MSVYADFSLEKITQFDPEDLREDVCPICLEDDKITIAHDGRDWIIIKGNDTLITNCGHAFHKKCLEEWLDTGKRANKKCLICKNKNWLVNTQPALKDSYLSRIKDLTCRFWYNPSLLKKPLLNTLFFTATGAASFAFASFNVSEFGPLESAALAAAAGSLAGVVQCSLLHHPRTDKALEEQLTIQAVESSWLFGLASNFAFSFPTLCHNPWTFVSGGLCSWTVSTMAIPPILESVFHIRNHEAIDDTIPTYTLASAGSIIGGWTLQQFRC